MSKRTEGPWEVVELSMDHLAVMASESNLAVCKLSQRREVAEANGQLIAAAPDLLTACEAYIRGIDSGHEPPGHIRKIHADMRAAVARATGGTP